MILVLLNAFFLIEIICCIDFKDRGVKNTIIEVFFIIFLLLLVLFIFFLSFIKDLDIFFLVRV